MDDLMVVFSGCVLIGVGLIFTSLFFLKDGLPEQLAGVKGLYSPKKPLKEYYRSPGYFIWSWGLVILNVGWLGTTIIRIRLDPDVLAFLPVDLYPAGRRYGEDCSCSHLLPRPGTDPSPTENSAESVPWLRCWFRGPGFRVFCAGLVMLILTRLV